MPPNRKPFTGYSNGSEMWRDNAMSYGIDEAVSICRSYLDMNLKREHAQAERQFCRELFAAMYEATVGITDASKLVYPYDLKTAEDRTEGSYFYASRNLNVECAHGIDRIIRDSCYESNRYSLEIAAMLAVLDYGFARVSLVLAFNYRNKGSDGRLSSANRLWANGFTMQEKAFNSTWLRSHATLIDGFCTYVREMYVDFAAERFVLPGQTEHGELNGGYEIIRAISTSDNGEGFSTGYVIGHNPNNNLSPWVCWQFAVRDGERVYNWGIYGDEQDAVDAYIARVFVALH